jgi:hypothetical protein
VTNLVAKANQNKINQENSNVPDITIWEFSGYNSVTMVAVPNDENHLTATCYDDQHYQPEIGDLVLKVMLANGNRPANMPATSV